MIKLYHFNEMHKTWDYVLSEIRLTQKNIGCIQFYVEPISNVLDIW